MSLDVDRVGRTVSGNVNEYGIRSGFREVRNPGRFCVETSGWKSFLLRFAGHRTVTEVPDARYYDRRAIVAMGVRLDLGVCRNAQADRVGADLGRVPRDHSGPNAGDSRGACPRIVRLHRVDLARRDAKLR